MQRVVIGIGLLALFLATAGTAYAQSDEKKETELGPITRKTQEEATEDAKAPSAVTPVVTAAPVDPKTYTIGPEDILLIRVWRENELSGGVQVRPDGMITLNLIGEVKAAGLTPEQLTAEIVKRLEEMINEPKVMVSVQQVLSKKYYITGEVNRTGAFPLVVPITVLEALTVAGGFRDFANPGKIVIMRGTERLKFNYKEVIKGKNMEQNILLQNGDYIVVPD